ncbi:hypothetical protein VTN02DRAFT_6414 [Thermoascus thermophilus]
MMSGNFDYPPASNRSSRGRGTDQQPDRSSASITARLQHLRDLLSSERARDRSGYTNARALETLNQELEELRSDRARDRTNYEQARETVDRQLQQLQSDLTARRIYRRVFGRERDPSSLSSNMEQEPNPTDPQHSASRPRRRGLRQSEALARFRDSRTRSGGGDMDGLQGLQQAVSRMREADSAISALLDDPVPALGSPDLRAPDYSIDSQTNRWRAKRRKLDSDDTREGLRGFRYGQYGQVVPGELKMEIVSCDGGAYSEPNGESSWPENVLLNDSSVYCTKSDRCNLILRHRGETPFCLKKLVIKAPKSGFDAPIQEGMIFVSMTSDELLARTAQYQIQYSPSRRRPYRNRRHGTQPSEEYLNSYRSPLQSLERTVLADPDMYSDSEIDSTVFATTRAGPPTHQDPTSEFRVTTEYDDKSEDGDEEQESDEELSGAAEIQRMYMAQMEDFLCPEDEDSESDDDSNELGAYNRGRLEMRRRMRAAHRQSSVDDSLRRRRSQAPEVMKPHARFFIEREKSMVSIKFDPPPSGRFILIKLWSPYSGGNIDIQSIVAHGFAGPRFFPAGEFR